MWRVLGGPWVATVSGVAWPAATRCHQCCNFPRLLAFSGKVAEAVAMETTMWQMACRYLMRVGKAVETSAVKLHRDL